MLHNLVHSEYNTTSLIVPNELLNVTPMIFNITSVILLSAWCKEASRRDHNNPWYCFVRNIRLNFVDMIDWFSSVFTEVLWLTGKWMLSSQKIVNQNSFKIQF